MLIVLSPGVLNRSRVKNMTEIAQIHLRGESGRDTVFGVESNNVYVSRASSARPPTPPVGFGFIR
jgi:hypothetical protein